MKRRNRDRVLSSVVVLLFVALPTTTRAEPENLYSDAVALWKFDASSSNTLTDASGNGHHGRIVGARWIKTTAGDALSFVRADSNYVSVPDSPDLHLQPPYTLGLWFRTTSSQNNAVYLIKSGGAFTGCGVYYYGDSKAMYVDAKGVDGQLYHKGSSSKTLPDGDWHHVVATFGNGREVLYVDGRIFAERDVPADLKLDYSGTPGVQLGRWMGNGHFDGMLGKAFILNRIWTHEDVQTAFRVERRRFNNSITITHTTDAPKIDGRIDDACWQSQPELTRFTRDDYDSTEAAAPTTVRLALDADHLYVAVVCERVGSASSTARPSRDDPRIRDDDHVAVFLRTNEGNYQQFVLTPAGAVLDRICHYEIERSDFAPGSFASFESDDKWDCRGLRTAARRDGDTWSAELSIPLAALGDRQESTQWGVNIVRFDKASGESSSFTPLFGGWQQSEQFSTLAFGKSTATLTRAPRRYVSVDITPGADTNRDLTIDGKPVVFPHNYLARGSYTTQPAGDAKKKTGISLFASLGEFEPASFCVRATGRELHDVRVALTDDLRTTDGAVIPASNVDIRVVELWRRQIDSRRHAWMERFLERPSSLDIPRHTTRRFWLTVHAPKDAVPASYQSTVAITEGSAVLASLDLQLRVLPIHLEQDKGMGYFMYLPDWGIPRPLRTKDYLKRIFVDMRQHGMTTATLYPYGLPFADVMDVLRDSRLMARGVPAIWLGADAVVPDRWKAVLDEGKRKRWPELALYLQDEPGDQERIDNAKRLFARLSEFRKQHPEHRSVRSTTAIGKTGIEALGEHYDIWIAGAGFDQQLVKQSQQMKKLLWSYDCNLAPVDALSCRHYFGLWCWKTGIKGSALWAYSDPGTTSGDGWEVASRGLINHELHYAFVRPDPDDLVPTIGWEAVREGVDDHRYLTTLSKAITRAEAAGHTAEARRARGVLQELSAKIDIKGYRAGIAGGAACGLRMGEHYDRTSPQPGIPSEAYNSWRRRIAEEIMRLNGLGGN